MSGARLVQYKRYVEGTFQHERPGLHCCRFTHELRQTVLGLDKCLVITLALFEGTVEKDQYSLTCLHVDVCR